MKTSWGKQVEMVYRVHITCAAGHTWYLDYAHYRSAKRSFERWNTTDTGWYATWIEPIQK